MSDESVPRQSTIEDTVLRLIKLFIQRLRVLQNAIWDLHPRLILRQKNITNPRERAEFIKNYWRTTKGIGIWQNEWKYRVHGAGCQLINIHSGEPLHWDIGHRNRFDKSWFVDYVVWILNKAEREKFLAPLLSRLDEISRYNVQEVVFPILNDLSKKQVLSGEINGHTYVLLE